MKSCQNFSRGI